MARFLLLLALSLWQTLVQAHVASPVLERAMLHDPGNLSIEQAAASGFRPYTGQLGAGFQTGAMWIRLTVARPDDAHDEAHRHWILRVGPHYLERIELYTQTGGQWQRQVRGALLPDASRHCPDDRHCFTLPVSADGPSTAYLRIEHRGFLAAQVDVLSPEALAPAVAERTRGLTASLTMALGLLVLGLVLLAVDRSILLLAYCSFQLTVVLFIASNAGLPAKVFPSASGETLNLFNHMLYALRGAMTTGLAWAFLRPYRPARAHQAVGQLLLALCGANTLLIALGQVQLGLKGSLLSIAVVPVWHLHGTLTARAMPRVLRGIMFAGTSVAVVMLVLGLYLAFGQDPAIPKTSFISQIADWRLNGFAVGMLFFLVTLLERTHQKRMRERELESLRLQAIAASAQQAKLEERSGLIDMLTHELKNPLGTIRFALASLRPSVDHPQGLKRIQSIDLSARRMDDLIERVASLSKVERTPPSASPAEVDAAGLVQEMLADLPQSAGWEVHVHPGTRLRCDRQLLWVILENLVSNADKYAQPGGPIRIEVFPERDASADAMVRFEISNPVDPGCVPDESRLFERYYRHPQVQDKAGMGIGLSVVKSALQKIQGAIAYRHEQGRVFFTVRVPA